MKRCTIAELRPHPRNYRKHPDSQLEHLTESLREHGMYRNIVIAKDGTVLAGHGVVEAAKKMGATTVPVIRLPVNPNDTRGLKVLTGDNEMSRLAEQDDRALSEILKAIKDANPAELLGTGFDQQMLSALVFVTRGADEMPSFDAAAEWVGMPDHVPGDLPFRLYVQCKSEADRLNLLARLGLDAASCASSKNGI